MKRAIIVTALVVAALPAGAQSAADKCRENPRASWLAAQRRWLGPGMDDAIQRGWSIAGERIRPDVSADSAIAVLRQLAATRGSTWPTKSVAGVRGVVEVRRLANRDTALARAALKRMMEAGPEESFAPAVATLEDMVRLQSGRKQIYGTRFFLRDDGSLTLAPMEDSAHVDLRREDAGLPPFAHSVCLAKAAASNASGRPLRQ